MAEGLAATVVDGQAGVVRACAARTLAAAGAKVEWHEDWVRPASAKVMWSRRSGGLLRPVGRAAGHVAKAVWKRATRDVRFGHREAKGVLEPASGRSTIDFGSYAELHDGQQTFGGHSGRHLATLAPHGAHGSGIGMLWVLQVLLGTTEASGEGEDVLHGSTCAKLAIHVDMAVASEAIPGGLRSPQVESFEQLRALPGTVWLDGEHVRRVQFANIESRQLSLELWDFGVATDEFDWSRLPAFRSPAEAAHYSGQAEPWHRKLRTRIRP